MNFAFYFHMKKTHSRVFKRFSIFGLCVVILLCMAMILQTPHIGTLMNTRVVSQSFDGFANHTSSVDTGVAKDSKADDIKMPTDFWADGGAFAPSFDGGSGALNDPYLISTPKQLARMAYLINNEGGAYLRASYQLTADIDMSEKFWQPMGTWNNNRAFSGTFDGATHDIGADGVDRGTVHTIQKLIMKNHKNIDNGTTVGLFGLLGDQAVITNVIIDNAIAYLDPEIETSERATLAIVASQVRNDATVLFQNMAVYNSATFTLQTYIQESDQGLDFIGGEIKSGIYVGWQQGVDTWGDKAKGVIYINDAHVRMSSVLINIYLDLSGWDMSPDIVVNSVGGLIGEARQVDIQNSSFEGVVGIEVVRKDRNMDNAQFIYNAGGAIGTMDAYNDSTSFLSGVDLSGTIYLDTFKDETDGWSRSTATAQGSNINREVDWVADVRQIGSIIGDANMWGLGDVAIRDTYASFFVDAPKGDRIQLGDNKSNSVDSDGVSNKSSSLDSEEILNQSSLNDTVQISDKNINNNHKSVSQALIDRDFDTPEIQSLVANAKQYSIDNATMTGKRAFEPHASTSTRDGLEGPSTGIEGPPTAPAGPIVFAVVASVYVALYANWLFLGWGALYYAIASISLLASFAIYALALIVMVAVVVFAVLFAFWGAMKPKWESQVYVGAAIGSPGRKGITLRNVHVANSVIASDTLFSSNDKDASNQDSHNTTPTAAMIVAQPETTSVNTIGDTVKLGVRAKGTVMSDGSMGVDSVLSYQWYYNTIDSNQILDGNEEGFGGAKTVMLEGATDPSLDLTVDWVGSRYYFVKVTNNVIEFRGSNNSVTARVGNKKVSLKPAEITKQPEDLSINVGTADQKLSVEATASGDIDFQWWFNTIPSVEGAVILSGGTKSEFVPYQKQSGVYYYFAVVTVSVNIQGSTDTMRADTVSNFAKVEVLSIANDISISVQPQAEIETQHNMNTVLGVKIDLSTVNGNLSYQWYETDDTHTSDKMIAGATTQSLVVDTSVADITREYYVIATNTVASSKSTIKSTVSTVTVLPDIALDIDLIQAPKSDKGIANSVGLNLLVYATIGRTSNTDGLLRYQWYETNSAKNTNGTAITGATSPVLSLASDIPTLDYYYVEMYAINPQTGSVFVQKTDPVSVEFRDYTEYYFENSLDILNTATISTTQSQDADIKGSSISKDTPDTVDLKVSLDTSDLIGRVDYQWYVSDYADGADATAISGAVGSAWRVDTHEGIGTKYYFVKISNTAEVYDRVSSEKAGHPVYNTMSNSVTLSPIAIDHIGSNTHNGTGTIVLILVSATAVILLAAGLIFVLKNRNKENYYDRIYDKFK